MEILKDRNFEYGFLVSPLNSRMEWDGRKISFGKDGEPLWKFVQWFSNESIIDAKPKTEGNTTSYSNRYKTVAVSRKENGNATISLTCNAFEEYGGPVPSPDFYGWVHMGIEQHFAEPVYLSRLQKFVFSFHGKFDIENTSQNAQIDKCAGQCNFCFIIRNTNPQSPDFNKIIWNQVCLHDSRYDIPPEYCGIDAGVAECSGEFIYTMDAHRMLDKPFANTGEHFICYDWLPEMKEALDIVKSRGGMPHTDWADLTVNYLGMGFEIARGDIYRLELSDLSVQAE